jgi:hypothetical protein
MSLLVEDSKNEFKNRAIEWLVAGKSVLLGCWPIAVADCKDCGNGELVVEKLESLWSQPILESRSGPWGVNESSQGF